jgi:outer membrane protein assembly factor BamB
MVRNLRQHSRLPASISLLIIGTLVLICGTFSAEKLQFTYFRSDAGVADPKAGSLPDHLDSPDALRWRTPLDSGHSTPILCDGRIFLTTYSPATEEVATLALTAKTGQLAWKRVAPAVRIEEFNRETGGPAQATPACDGERLYVFFGSRGLICYDLEGRQLWEQRMGPFQDEYGSASSPILVEDKVIIQQDHDVDSFLMALDRKTGRILWNKKRPDAVRSYSTPAVWSHNGHNELLVAGALELAGYDPSNGERLWWIHGLARIVIPVPLPSGDLVYMASWAPGGDSEKRTSLDPWPVALRKWDKNGDGKLAKNEVDNPDVIDRFFRMDLDQSGDLDKEEWERHAAVFRRAQNGVLAVKPSTGVGELGDSAVVWRCPRGAPYVATPLVDRGIFWMVKDGGIVTKIIAATGQVLQVERLPSLGNYYASPVSADGKVYFASQQGVVSVIANEPGWRVIASHDFKEKIYATPVVEGGRLFIRTEKALYCFQAPR